MDNRGQHSTLRPSDQASDQADQVDGHGWRDWYLKIKIHCGVCQKVWLQNKVDNFMELCG